MREIIRKLFKAGFFHIFGSSVINKVLVFLSATVLVRILAKQEYGIFSYAWNIFSFALLFSGFGIEAGALQILSECKNEKERFENVFSFSLRFGCLFNIILAFIIVGIGYFVQLPIVESGSLLILLCLLPEIIIVYNLQTVYLRTIAENRSYSLISFVNTLSVSILTILGAFILESKGLIAGRYIGYILSVLFGFLFIKIPFSTEKCHILPSDKRDLFKISSIGLVNNGLSQLMYLLDVFVIGLIMISETEVASYKVATQIPNALTFIPAAVVTFIYPYFAEHRKEKNLCLHRYKQVLLAMGGFNLAISGVLFAFAPLIINLIFGEQYCDAITSFRILCISYFFSGTFRTISGNLLATQRKYYFQLFVAITSGLTNVIADYVLVKKYGIAGAAIATLSVTLLTALLNTSYLIYTFRKKEKEE